jgi:predicted nucleotidyltransferase
MLIRRLAKHVAERFQPDRIILFGSYAHGRPNPQSDVDLFVVMKGRNEIDQALRIEQALDPPFGLDVIVRTPRNIRWRLAEGDWFLREVVVQGKVLYEKADGRVGAQGRGRRRRAKKNLTPAASENCVHPVDACASAAPFGRPAPCN